MDTSTIIAIVCGGVTTLAAVMSQVIYAWLNHRHEVKLKKITYFFEYKVKVYQDFLNAYATIFNSSIFGDYETLHRRIIELLLYCENTKLKEHIFDFLKNSHEFVENKDRIITWLKRTIPLIQEDLKNNF